MNVVNGNGIYFRYDFDGNNRFALENVSIDISQGEFVAVLGHNGCGKSTLVKHFNALAGLQKGDLKVAGIDVRNEREIWELRRICGMVFQNPDNQFVSSVVEEDIAFGLENYDTPLEEIPDKVHAALALVGMDGFEKRAPHTLSGGQKQRTALAGVLAMEPEIIVFDEATAMLDPKGRTEILASMQSLHRMGKTVVMITHYVEEAVIADRIFLLSQGKILADGTPREILTNRELLQQAGLLPPIPVQLYYDLLDSGIQLATCPLTNEELVEEICRLN